MLKARSQHAERKALLAVAATLGEDLGQVDASSAFARASLYMVQCWVVPPPLPPPPMVPPPPCGVGGGGGAGGGSTSSNHNSSTT